MGGSYIPATIPEEEAMMNGMPVIGGVLLIVLFAFLFVMLVFSFVSYIFQGIGVMKMHEKLGLNNGWMAFVPILNSYALGRVAEQYVKEDGKKSARFSIILLVTQVISLFMVFFMGIALGIFQVLLPISAYTAINAVLSLLSNAVLLVSSVITYVALWRVFSIFANKNATLYLILSIFVSVVQPFLVFAIRNNEPMCVEVTQEVFVEEAVAENVAVTETVEISEE